MLIKFWRQKKIQNLEITAKKREEDPQSYLVIGDALRPDRNRLTHVEQASCKDAEKEENSRERWDRDLKEV